MNAQKWEHVFNELRRITAISNRLKVNRPHGSQEHQFAAIIHNLSEAMSVACSETHNTLRFLTEEVNRLKGGQL
jgi:hypothetical protein